MSGRDNSVGAGLLAAAMTLFTIGDTFVKLLAERVPIGQVICFRNILTTLLIALAWAIRRDLIRPRDLLDRGVLLRSLFDTATTLLYLYGVAMLPLGDAAAILFVSPLLATGLAGILLGERVGPVRWVAVTVGFAGVLLIVQPGGAAFRPATLLPLAAAGTMALADIVTRRIRPDVGAPTIVAANVVSVALAAGVATLLDARPLAVGDLASFTVAAGFLLLGYLTYVLAFRRGEVSFIAPFKYAGLPVAMLLGWLAWGDVPTPPVLLGAALIVGTGLVALAAERRRGPLPVATSGG
ncbi:MAG TPA: DMT family transporter [Geminicoccaceae bacterium]|nr:DMT family transporter [Geminicoccaceae bacterium]